MIKATTGDTVKVHYTGKLRDGTVFDASPEDRPLQFIIGKQEVIPGFEEAVSGMYQGENKTATISPQGAYGERHPERIEEIERDLLPEGLELQVGRQLEITGESGDKLLVMITGLTDTTVTLDGNHPLAGKELIFDIDLLEVNKAPLVSGKPDAEGG